MKNILIILMVIFLACEVFAAGELYVDTRVGIRSGAASTSFRDTRVEYLLMKDISAGVTYMVEDGLGLTGSMNNWRIGVYGVYNMFLLDPKYTFTPYIGASLSNSDVVSSSISIDAGFFYRLKGLPLDPFINLYVTGYSDSITAEFFIGPSFGLDFISNKLVLDLGYDGMLYIAYNPMVSKLTSGAAAKLSYRF